MAVNDSINNQIDKNWFQFNDSMLFEISKHENMKILDSTICRNVDSIWKFLSNTGKKLPSVTIS